MFSKKFVTIVALLAITSFQCVYSAVLNDIQKEDPGNPGMCSSKVGDKSIKIPVGTAVHDTNRCIEHRCFENEKTGFLTYKALTCGVVGPAPGCDVSAIQVGENYPDCCPMLICIDK